MTNVPEIYGSLVFNESTMRERLPKATYKQLMDTIKESTTPSWPPRPTGTPS